MEMGLAAGLLGGLICIGLAAVGSGLHALARAIERVGVKLAISILRNEE